MSEDPETLEGRIRERAYHLWLEAGCPDAREQEFWFLAREAETGSLTVQPDSLTLAEEQLMAEGERRSEVQAEPYAADKTDGMQTDRAAAEPPVAPGARRG